ncbi:zinc knuckle [Cooperia oncophora]
MEGAHDVTQMHRRGQDIQREAGCSKAGKSTLLWKDDYVDTVEKDGELVNELCDLLQTDVSQLKRTVEVRCREPFGKDWPGMQCDRRGSARQAVDEAWQKPSLQERPCTSVHNGRAHGRVFMKEEERCIPQELGSPKADGKYQHESWLTCMRIVREAKERAKLVLGNAKIAKQARTSLENDWDVVSEAVEKLAREALHHPVVSELMKEIVVTLSQRGIETGDEWRDYVDTVEKDGELVNELCDLLQTDVSQLKRTVEVRCREPFGKDWPGMQCDRRGSARQAVDEAWQKPSLQERPCTSVHNGRAHGVSPWSRAPLREDAEEFLRKFRRKYETVISCEETLLEILSDDHLAGRAKNVFASLPRAVRECGFEAVTQEMARLMAYDSTAGRMRALTELKNLRMRPAQEVSEFCVVLERLGKQANPECTLEDRSMEYAQILLDNLSDWPEHFQLVGALHRVEPRKAYEEVKQLALSIEQSRIMLGANERRSMAWKSRCAQYQHSSEQRPAVMMEERSSDSERRGAERKTTHNAELSLATEIEEMDTSDHEQQRQKQFYRETRQSRKCYRCERFGHIARECPEKTVVNHTFQKKSPRRIQKQSCLP